MARARSLCSSSFTKSLYKTAWDVLLLIERKPSRQLEGLWLLPCDCVSLGAVASLLSRSTIVFKIAGKQSLSLNTPWGTRLWYCWAYWRTWALSSGDASCEICSNSPRCPSVIHSGKMVAICFSKAANEHANAVSATTPMFRIANPPFSIGKIAFSYHSYTIGQLLSISDFSETPWYEATSRICCSLKPSTNRLPWCGDWVRNQ